MNYFYLFNGDIYHKKDDKPLIDYLLDIFKCCKCED